MPIGAYSPICEANYESTVAVNPVAGLPATPAKSGSRRSALGFRAPALVLGQGQGIPLPLESANYDDCYDQADSHSEGEGSVVINIVHRSDLDARVEKLTSCLGQRGRGRKTTVIERALAAPEEREMTAHLDPTVIAAPIQRYIDNSTRLSARLFEEGVPKRGRPLSALQQEALYDEPGLPR